MRSPESAPIALLLLVQGSHAFCLERRQAFLPASPASSKRASTSCNSRSSLRAKTDDEFWAQQKSLVQEMQDKSDRSLREAQMEKFQKRSLALVGDTAYFGFFIFCALWTVSDNPFVAISYSFGAAMGLAYAYGLGKYVETLGGSADDAGAVEGAGVGQARFAFLILLFVIVGKFRAQGLQEIPAIAGFFTYQLASLSQGLREIND